MVQLYWVPHPQQMKRKLRRSEETSLNSCLIHSSTMANWKPGWVKPDIKKCLLHLEIRRQLSHPYPHMKRCLKYIDELSDNDQKTCAIIDFHHSWRHIMKYVKYAPPFITYATSLNFLRVESGMAGMAYLS